MMTQIVQTLLDFIGAHPNLAILIVFLISAGEALFIIGLFVPSTVVLVSAGTLIGMGKLAAIPIFLATMTGAIVGDGLSYWIGHIWKEHIRRVWPFSRYTSLLDRGEAFFAQHGGKSIFIGRFIPGVKAVVPGVAGIVGMNPIRFTAINVFSAIIWTGAHLLPGMGLGRAIEVARTANPKLLVLLILLVLSAAFCWFSVKLIIRFIMPHVDQWRANMVVSLEARDGRMATTIRRLLRNDDGFLTLFGYVAWAMVAIFGLISLLVSLLFDPELLLTDNAVSHYLETLRTPAIDKVMTAITMFGDGTVQASIAVALVVALLLHRQWKTSIAVTVAFLSATAFVPVVKLILHRAGPTGMYQGAEAFSFPSSHATLSTTIIGIASVILARALSEPKRWRVYLPAASCIAAISFSRLYLLAHWPSDVIAGILFGGTLIFMMAVVLHQRPAGFRFWRVAAIIGVTIAVVFPAHLYFGFGATQDKYAQNLPQETMSQADWLQSGWQKIPGKRVLLDGDNGEPIVLQTDMPLAGISDTLKSLGWHRDTSGRTNAIVSAILPASGPLADRPSLPLTNGGFPAVATFTKPAGPALPGRMVIRLWPTGFDIRRGSATSPLLSLSITKEAVDSRTFGFGGVEPGEQEIVTSQSIAYEIARALTPRVVSRRNGETYVVLVARKE